MGLILGRDTSWRVSINIPRWRIYNTSEVTNI